MCLEDVLNLVLDKLKEALQLALNNLGRQIQDRFGQVFPPDKITNWIHVSLFYLTAAVVCSVVVCLCQCCCGGGGGRMMKAPGRNGGRIRKSAFEGNPRGYFKELRSRPHDS